MKIQRAIRPSLCAYTPPMPCQAHRGGRTTYEQLQAQRVEYHAARVEAEEARLQTGWTRRYSDQRKWTEAELDVLRQEALVACSQEDLARRGVELLRRTLGSVRGAILLYGIRATGPKHPRGYYRRPWNSRELAILRAELARPVPIMVAARRVSSLIGRRVIEVLGMAEAMR